MKKRSNLKSCLGLLVFVLWSGIGDAREQTLSQSQEKKIAEPPLEDVVRERWISHLKSRQFTEEDIREVIAIWSANSDVATSQERLGKMIASVGVFDPELVAWAREVRLGATENEHDVSRLEDKKFEPFIRDAVKMWIAQGWIHCGRHDDADALLEGLETEALLDPVSYAFTLATIHHQRADKEQGMVLLEWLRGHADSIPERYAVLGNLMYEDLRQLQAGSLDDISRRMKQIYRRLDLGQTGDGVLKTEDEVLRMLDRLIEQEAKKQANRSQAGTQAGAPARPADASRPMGGKGPGQVTKKKIGQTTGWGDLPPKEREEAMQELSREFPAHYREVIEAYFRELARQQK